MVWWGMKVSQKFVFERENHGKGYHRTSREAHERKPVQWKRLKFSTGMRKAKSPQRWLRGQTSQHKD
ncbi:hypothetical protein TNCV_2593641 [Trichonephila clavipes]|nr:hypothetical protein TNCV_2593641 [Trichonephila clavipes]